MREKDRAGWDSGRQGRGGRETLPRFELHVQGSWIVRHISLEVHLEVCVQKETILGQCCLSGARATAVCHHAELKVKMR